MNLEIRFIDTEINIVYYYLNTRKAPDLVYYTFNHYGTTLFKHTLMSKTFYHILCTSTFLQTTSATPGSIYIVNSITTENNQQVPPLSFAFLNFLKFLFVYSIKKCTNKVAIYLSQVISESLCDSKSKIPLPTKLWWI